MADSDDLAYEPPPADAPPAASPSTEGQASPPDRNGMLRLAGIGLVVAAIALLALRVLVLATVSAVAPMPPPRPQEAPATPTAVVPTPATPELDPATAAPGGACPEGVMPPDGVPVGWLARVAGCSNIALATLDGVRQWVRRDRLDDDIYNQLPEVVP